LAVGSRNSPAGPSTRGPAPVVRNGSSGSSGVRTPGIINHQPSHVPGPLNDHSPAPTVTHRSFSAPSISHSAPAPSHFSAPSNFSAPSHFSAPSRFSAPSQFNAPSHFGAPSSSFGGGHFGGGGARFGGGGAHFSGGGGGHGGGGHGHR